MSDLKPDATPLELAIATLDDLEVEAVEVMKDYRRRVAEARQLVAHLRLAELQAATRAAG